jgi:hypothetical protein
MHLDPPMERHRLSRFLGLICRSSPCDISRGQCQLNLSPLLAEERDADRTEGTKVCKSKRIIGATTANMMAVYSLLVFVYHYTL